jgi:hypothetical protein
MASDAPAPTASLLNALSPQALGAAMKTGADQWGLWGSASVHALYVEGAQGVSRRLCRCGCRRRVSHRAGANGMTLAMGCELSMRRWVKEMSDAQ